MQNSLILPIEGNWVSPINGRIKTETVPDFDLENNSLKEQRK
jgi:hypothetical protein